MKFAVVICVMATLLGPAMGNVLLCYFASWATYRSGNGTFQVSGIDSSLCTHFIYAFVGITGEGSIDVMDKWNDMADDGGQDNFGKLVTLKNAETAPKIIISIGGWNAGSTNFTIVVNDPDLRSTFVTNAVAFLKQYDFDGLDLDWQYPNQRGGQESDVSGFTSLIQELKAAFAEDGFILTAAVGATENLSSPSYDIPALAENLDYISIMTYDLHVAGENDIVGHHAPLYPASYQADNEDILQNNVNASINFWLNNGAPASKLALGIPFYGRTFTLADTSNTAPGSRSTGAGMVGPYSGIPGTIGYNELCEEISNGNWTTVWFDEQEVPYSYNGEQWVGYDNERSITNKINLAKSLGVENVMIWSIDDDDFTGNCGGSTYPLLRAVNAALFNTTDA